MTAAANTPSSATGKYTGSRISHQLHPTTPPSFMAMSAMPTASHGPILGPSMVTFMAPLYHISPRYTSMEMFLSWLLLAWRYDCL